MIRDTYDATDPKEIVRLSKEIFGTTVCGTCRGQLIPAYQKLTKHFRDQGDQMAGKKNADNTATKEKPAYKLKPEFEGARHADGQRSIFLSDVALTEVEKHFTPEEIAEYFEKANN